MVILDLIMLLSDWYANKIEKERQARKRMNEHVVKEVVRQRTLMDLREAEQRGLSVEENNKRTRIAQKNNITGFSNLESIRFGYY